MHCEPQCFGYGLELQYQLLPPIRRIVRNAADARYGQQDTLDFLGRPLDLVDIPAGNPQVDVAAGRACTGFKNREGAKGSPRLPGRLHTI